ncbi:hypothetical protein C0J52_14626 [Blattella germanica]|nr:hypothetical protein C0J52_14626 [Blattella germanica]
MDKLEQCIKIDEHLIVLENEIKLLREKYQEVNNLEPSEDNQVRKAAVGYLESVQKKIDTVVSYLEALELPGCLARAQLNLDLEKMINTVVSCLEALELPECLARVQLNLDLEVISEDSSDDYDLKVYKKKDPMM